MTFLTLSQAAKAANKSKSTVHEAIRTGRLSAFKNDKNQWQLDPDELFRVYPQAEQKPDTKTEAAPGRPNEETAILRQRVEFLEQRVNDIKNERDDLRRRLNEEAEERFKTNLWMRTVIDEQALFLSNKFDLTPDQFNLFTLLVKGKYVITQVYFRGQADLNPGDFFSIIDDLKKIGVLGNTQGSNIFGYETFSTVINSILQGRDINEITLNDFVNIARRFGEWRILPTA